MLIHCVHTCIRSLAQVTLFDVCRTNITIQWRCCPNSPQHHIPHRLYHHRITSKTTEIYPAMSSLPIRESQDASSADESSSGALSILDHDTDHQAYPTSPSPSNVSKDHGHDHASDAHSETPSDPPDNISEASSREHADRSPTSPQISIQGTSGSSSDDSADADTNIPAETPENLPESTSLLLPLPKSSPGLLTHAHQQAMANRIKYDHLLPGGNFDPDLYTPVFLHDMLMLPGSLATVIGKVRHPIHPPPPPKKSLN